jgi:hypothetical protein
MIKVLKKLGIKRMYLNIIKAIYAKHIANIITNGEKTEIISSKARKQTKVSSLIQYNFGIPSQTTTQEIK